MEEHELLEAVRLSPSRASDFKTCPQLFKFRTIDQLPEPTDPSALVGTAVHAVLERVMHLPAATRGLEKAKQELESVWTELLSDPQISEWLPAGIDLGAMALEALRLVRNYYLLEDPRAVEVHEIEWWVEHDTDRTILRGIIDRVEVDEDGSWILTDYKTGRSPSETYAFGSFFGLRFYALVCWRAFGKMPKELRLFHLREPVVVTLAPNERMLIGLERQLEAIGIALKRAHLTGDWRPRPGRICSWCPHRQICPAFATERLEQREQVVG